MKRKDGLGAPASDRTVDTDAVDSQYGLEPVFEPGRPDPVHPTEFVTVQCPYCGERFQTEVDVSAGAFSYIEDCQVCCQPIELAGEREESGELARVTATRAV